MRAASLFSSDIQTLPNLWPVPAINRPNSDEHRSQCFTQLAPKVTSPRLPPPRTASVLGNKCAELTRIRTSDRRLSVPRLHQLRSSDTRTATLLPPYSRTSPTVWPVSARDRSSSNFSSLQKNAQPRPGFESRTDDYRDRLIQEPLHHNIQQIIAKYRYKSLVSVSMHWWN